MSVGLKKKEMKIFIYKRERKKSLRHVCRTDLSVGAVLSTIAAPVCRLERQVSFLQVGNTREALIGTIDRAIVGGDTCELNRIQKVLLGRCLD